LEGFVKHYPHHIGDFDRATRHLTRIERSIYRDLIDLYYDTETRLTLDKAWLCRKIIARSNEESTAVEQVLNEFFTETPTGWYHDRCEAEIEAYHANTSQKAMAGKASAAAKRLKKLHALNGHLTDVEQPLNSVETDDNGTPTNHQPSTINQEPYSVSKDTDGQAVKSPNDLTKTELWSAGKSLLEAAGLPAKQCGSFVGKLVKDYGDATVIEAVRAAVLTQPADPAEYLKAACLRSTGQRQPVNKQIALEQRNRAVGEEWLASQGDIHAVQ
jgi:uncharacterized protein YdaU (DUF1376 family)